MKMIEGVRAQYPVSYIEFQALISYIRDIDIETRYLTGAALALYNSIEDYATKYGVYPTCEFIEEQTQQRASDILIPIDKINEELKRNWLTVQIQQRTVDIINYAPDNPQKALDDLIDFTYEMNCTLANDAKDEVIKFSDINIRLKEYQDPDQIAHRRCSWGLPIIDDNTNGLCDGDLAFIVGATNQGKSWLSKKVAVNNVLAGKKVILLPFEEIGKEAIRRIDATFAGISSKGYMEKTLDAKQFHRIQEKAIGWKLQDGPKGELWIPDIRQVKRGDAKDILKLLKNYDADLIIIDQLSLMAKTFDWKDIAVLVNELKDVCMDAQRPILCLAQAKINYIKPIEEVDAACVALGEEISRSADSMVYVGNHRDSDQIGTKFFKLFKTRRGKQLITRNKWDLDFSSIEELAEFIPDPTKKTNVKFGKQQQNNTPQQPKPITDYTSVWKSK